MMQDTMWGRDLLLNTMYDQEYIQIRTNAMYAMIAMYGTYVQVGVLIKLADSNF